MKFRALLLVLFLAACATTSPFTGPVSERPLLSVSYMRHVEHTNDFWQIPYVTNPSLHPIHVALDCTVSRTVLDIPARTTEHVLLDPKDASCELK
jgi:hypothetical protein